MYFVSTIFCLFLLLLSSKMYFNSLFQSNFCVQWKKRRRNKVFRHYGWPCWYNFIIIIREEDIRNNERLVYVFLISELMGSSCFWLYFIVCPLCGVLVALKLRYSGIVWSYTIDLRSGYKYSMLLDILFLFKFSYTNKNTLHWLHLTSLGQLKI